MSGNKRTQTIYFLTMSFMGKLEIHTAEHTVRPKPKKKHFPLGYFKTKKKAKAFHTHLKKLVAANWPDQADSEGE